VGMAGSADPGGRNALVDKSGIPHDFFPELRGNALFSPQGAELVFAGAPKTLEQVSSAARASKPQAFALPVNAHIHTEATLRSATSIWSTPGTWITWNLFGGRGRQRLLWRSGQRFRSVDVT
jgi:hypothetical protein